MRQLRKIHTQVYLAVKSNSSLTASPTLTISAEEGCGLTQTSPLSIQGGN